MTLGNSHGLSEHACVWVCIRVFECAHMYARACNYWTGDSAQSPVQTPGSAPLCSDSGQSCPWSLLLLTVMAPSYRALREISPKKVCSPPVGSGEKKPSDWEDSRRPLPIEVSLGNRGFWQTRTPVPSSSQDGELTAELPVTSPHFHRCLFLISDPQGLLKGSGGSGTWL